MRLLIDAAAAARFDLIRPEIVNGEVRGYYCTTATDERLALIVVRRRLLSDVVNKVVDASVGWDAGTPGYVHVASRQHSKVTIYGLATGAPESTLSEILHDAPLRRPEP